ncbi:MAG TPA: CbbQ/NirQ/NorQ/GpvN family protein [Chitinophagaceae bacterium]|nr:CbbQ/NirQ/NorQ/GpvN family protein [Chitinophagaceae bacterium]HNF71763.1 CbbQ/NirQ/NorQ/GpvN family protein [Chitinophagaceae bacterium]
MQNSILNTPYYEVIAKEDALFEHAYRNQIPLLLKGPTGSGKSRFVEYMAAQLGLDLITISCHEETSATDLIGRFIIKGSETVWLDGPLSRAVRSGCMVYLDEIAEARPDVLVSIHALTDHRRMLYIDKLGETLQAPDSFMLVASFNPGYQRGFKELKPSTRQRFAAISFHYPNVETEVRIIQQESGIAAALAQKLVSLAHKIRNLKELGLTETASTRLLVDAAKLIQSGLPKRMSVRAAILEPLSDDEDIVEAMQDLSNLIL